MLIISLVALVEDPEDENSSYHRRRFRPVPEEVEDIEDILAI